MLMFLLFWVLEMKKLDLCIVFYSIHVCEVSARNCVHVERRRTVHLFGRRPGNNETQCPVSHSSWPNSFISSIYHCQSDYAIPLAHDKNLSTRNFIDCRQYLWQIRLYPILVAITTRAQSMTWKIPALPLCTYLHVDSMCYSRLTHAIYGSCRGCQSQVVFFVLWANKLSPHHHCQVL